MPFRSWPSKKSRWGYMLYAFILTNIEMSLGTTFALRGQDNCFVHAQGYKQVDALLRYQVGNRAMFLGIDAQRRS